MSDIQAKLRELIIDDSGLTAELIARAKRFIRLTRDGKVVFMVPLDMLPIWARVLLYVTGKRLAKEAGLITNESGVVTIEEISTAVGADYFKVRQILSDFVDQNLVVSVERDGYIVNLAMLHEIIKLVENRKRSPV
ncbi:MAG: hypothetical protein QW580_02095 [Nitrososphaerota archaeon]